MKAATTLPAVGEADELDHWDQAEYHEQICKEEMTWIEGILHPALLESWPPLPYSLSGVRHRCTQLLGIDQPERLAALWLRSQSMGVAGERFTRRGLVTYLQCTPLGEVKATFREEDVLSATAIDEFESLATMLKEALDSGVAVDELLSIEEALHDVHSRWCGRVKIALRDDLPRTAASEAMVAYYARELATDDSAMAIERRARPLPSPVGPAAPDETVINGDSELGKGLRDRKA